MPHHFPSQNMWLRILGNQELPCRSPHLSLMHLCLLWSVSTTHNNAVLSRWIQLSGYLRRFFPCRSACLISYKTDWSPHPEPVAYALLSQIPHHPHLLFSVRDSQPWIRELLRHEWHSWLCSYAGMLRTAHRLSAEDHPSAHTGSPQRLAYLWIHTIENVQKIVQSYVLSPAWLLCDIHLPQMQPEGYGFCHILLFPPAVSWQSSSVASAVSWQSSVGCHLSDAESGHPHFLCHPHQSYRYLHRIGTPSSSAYPDLSGQSGILSFLWTEYPSTDSVSPYKMSSSFQSPLYARYSLIYSAWTLPASLQSHESDMAAKSIISSSHYQAPYISQSSRVPVESAKQPSRNPDNHKPDSSRCPPIRL